MCYTRLVFPLAIAIALVLTMTPYSMAQWGMANVETVASGPDNQEIGESAIALDDQGTLHVVYDQIASGDHNFYYKQKLLGGIWSDPYPVGDHTAQLSSSYLDVHAPSGVAYLVYLENSLLKIGLANDCVWEYYSLRTPNLEAIYDPSLAVDANGYAHVAFVVYDAGAYHVGYGYWEGPGATDFYFQLLDMTVLGAFGAGGDPEICVRSDGSVAICYRGGGYLMYQVDVVENSSLGGTDWTVQTVDVGGYECYPGNIKATANDDIHVAFHGSMGFGFPNDIFYASKPAGAGYWNTPIEVGGTLNGADPKLYVRDNSDAHLIAMETSGNFYTGNTVYATNQSGSWMSMYLQQGQAYDPSLVIDDQGNGNMVFKEYMATMDHDVFYYGYVAPIGPQPDLDVTLTPEAIGIIIPVSGGSFEYQLEVQSNLTLPSTFDVWVDIVPPAGSPLEIMNREITLPELGSRSADFEQVVPNRAPGGNYYLRAFAGTYPNVIVDADSFEFGKVGDDGNMIYEGWFSQNILDEAMPSSVELISAFPNPFNPSSVLTYTLQKASLVDLAVYDISGRKISQLVDNWMDAGDHQVTFDGADLPSGVYIYRMVAGDVQSSGKLVLMK